MFASVCRQRINLKTEVRMLLDRIRDRWSGYTNARHIAGTTDTEMGSEDRFRRDSNLRDGC